MNTGMGENRKPGRGPRVRTRNAKETLRTLKSLDYSYDDLARFLTYSKKYRVETVGATIPPDVDIEDLVKHLDSVCCDIMVDWQSLQRLCPESMATFNTMLGSLLRVLVNVTFLFDNDKLPGLFVSSDSLNEHIVHMCISWVLDLRIRDYKYNETGATLTNLITVLHNYVSYEFSEEEKPFCTLLLAHGRLPAFLCVTVDLVVGRVGTDVVLRNSLQQVCVEFWNAVVNWNIAEDSRFKELRRVFAKHLKLRELMDLLIKRIQARDEESIYFVTLLFDAEEFVSRILADELSDTRRKYLDVVVAECKNLLESLELQANHQILLFETLICIAKRERGRACLLTEHLNPFLELILKFVDAFDSIVRIGAQVGEEESSEASEALSAKKLLGLVFRLYGAMHEDGHLFLERLLEHFSGGAGMSRLREHLQSFHGDPLLRNNDIIETEDVDRFYLLFVALKKRLKDQGVEEEPRPGPVLSRVAAERFKSLTPGPFRVPFPLAMSVEFSEALSSALDQALVQNVDGQSSELVVVVDESEEEEVPEAEAQTAAGTEEQASSGGEVTHIARPGKSDEKLDHEEAEAAHKSSAKQDPAADTPHEPGADGSVSSGKRKVEGVGDSSDGGGTGAEPKRARTKGSTSRTTAQDSQGAEILLDLMENPELAASVARVDSSEQGPGAEPLGQTAVARADRELADDAPTRVLPRTAPGPESSPVSESDAAAQVQDNLFADDAQQDFRVSSPEFIDPADYMSDQDDADLRLRCKVVVGKDVEKTRSAAPGRKPGEGGREAHQLSFDFRPPRWSEMLAGSASSKAQKYVNTSAPGVLSRGRQGVSQHVPHTAGNEAGNKASGQGEAPAEYVYIDDSDSAAPANDVPSCETPAQTVSSKHCESNRSATDTGKLASEASVRTGIQGNLPSNRAGLAQALQARKLAAQAPSPASGLDNAAPPNAGSTSSAHTLNEVSSLQNTHHTTNLGNDTTQLARMFGGVRAADSQTPAGAGLSHSAAPQVSHVAAHSQRGSTSRTAQLDKQTDLLQAIPTTAPWMGKDPGIKVQVAQRKNSRRHVEIACMINIMKQQSKHQPVQNPPEQILKHICVNSTWNRAPLMSAFPPNAGAVQSFTVHEFLSSGAGQQWAQSGQPRSLQSRDQRPSFPQQRGSLSTTGGNKTASAVFSPTLGGVGALNAAILPGVGNGLSAVFGSQ